MEITYEDFRKVNIHVGTVLSVNNNEKARQSALVLEVDFGSEIGIKTVKFRAQSSNSHFWCLSGSQLRCQYYFLYYYENIICFHETIF